MRGSSDADRIIRLYAKSLWLQYPDRIRFVGHERS
jgi:hypothetical protein